MQNIEKARSTLAHIRKYPEQHDQAEWVNGPVSAVAADNGDHPDCGTTMCFAGWFAFLHAPKGARINDESHIVFPDIRANEHVSDFTAGELGLTDQQADALFINCNTVAELEAAIEHLHANPRASRGEVVAGVLFPMRGQVWV